MCNTTDAQIASPCWSCAVSTCDTDVVTVFSRSAFVSRTRLPFLQRGQETPKPTLVTLEARACRGVCIQGCKDTGVLFLTRAVIRHERRKVRVDDVVVMESRQRWLASRVLVEILVEGRTIIVPDMTHVLVLGVMAFVAGRAWSPAERTQRPRGAWPSQSLRAHFNDMRSALLLAAALPRHGYTDGWRTNLCVVTLRLVGLVVVKVFCLMVVVDGCLIVVGVVGRIVVVTVQDVLTRLAYSQVAWLGEELACDNGRALGVEDLATGAAVVLSAECREGISAVEAILCVLVSHPELSVQDLPPHLPEGAPGQAVDCRACVCLALNLLDGRYCRRTHCRSRDDGAYAVRGRCS